MKNPFDDGGSLPKNEFATHTWDIVALLGKYDELLDEKKLDTIRRWRDMILKFVYEEEDWFWPEWSKEEGTALRVGEVALDVLKKEDYMEEDGKRRYRLLELAKKEKGEEGWDYLWEGVCRRWLD